MFIHRNIVILLFLFRNGCLAADKKHFAKWIKADFREIYIFETLLGKGLDQCIESCKAKKMCEYINLNVKTDACFLIGVSSIQESLDHSDDDGIETKRGFVLGKKQDWNLEKYGICSECEDIGECKRDEQSDEYTMCQKSGCGPPENKQFTVVHGNMFAVGNKLEYQCQQGYTDVSGDSGIMTCPDSGAWSSTSIKCVPDEAATNCFGNNSCYLLDKTKRNWQDGKNYCESLGGYLADIKTELENEFIEDNIFSTVETYTWLGGNDEENEGSFIWTDGTPVDGGYSGWEIGEPNRGQAENCLAYAPKWYGVWKHKWHDAPCSWTFTVLCEF